MIAVDFFCGAGGLTRGLLNAGIDVVLGIDADEGCRETYEANNQPSHFLHADVRTLTFEDVREYIPAVAAEELFFAACAPCQPFTQLKKTEDTEGAATLLGQFGRFVQEFLPRYIFIENVPGLARVRGSSTYRRFRRLLTGLGYQYWEGVVDAKMYGVPQKRRRFIIVAVMGVTPTVPPATHGPGLIPYETVREAIQSYPTLGAGEINAAIPNHRAAVLTDTNLERIRNTPHDGGDRTAWPLNLWLPCHLNGHKGHTDVYGRMYWDLPAPTLTCKFNSLSNGRYGHPEQDRAISLREGAKLQSFEDTYIFHATSTVRLAAQIGNAVPVRLAEAVGLHMLGYEIELRQAA
jgi:DNA (cytosine-5)-methyltransferase 1